MHRTTAMLLALGSSASLGCSESDSAAPTSVSGEHLALAHAPPQTFGYFGPKGPASWGELDPAWDACANGRIQSPVDLGPNTLQSQRHANLNIDYGLTTGAIFNNGHTIEVETEGENVLRLGGVSYALSQFHFHVPSEHTIRGEGHDMELHLVHTSPAGTNAVVAIFLDRARGSGALAPIFRQLPNDFNVQHELNAAFDPADFLPDGRSNIRFRGSLTTPPCTGGVQWVVLTDPVRVSNEHLARFHERIHFNARPVQRSLP
jgi:carbonic anhydrase